VFAYQLLADRSPLPPEQVFEFRGGQYAFIAVRLADYAPHARPISASWDTVAMPTGLFRELAQPMDALLAPPGASVAATSAAGGFHAIGYAAPPAAAYNDDTICNETDDSY
jgi:hypothetical protein